jgi:hypothetical protein
VHSISFCPRLNQEENECTNTLEKLTAYCLDIYTVL